MARNMSLWSLRIAELMIKGIETKVAVDASGSASLKLKYTAIPTINKAITREVECSKTVGIMPASESSPSISCNVVSSDIAEKHNK